MTTMSAVETDLDDDGGLRSEAYLDALVDRAPSVDSLLNDVRRLQIYKGFIVFAPPDDKCGADELSKSEVEEMLSIDTVNWERLYRVWLFIEISQHTNYFHDPIN